MSTFGKVIGPTEKGIYFENFINNNIVVVVLLLIIVIRSYVYFFLLMRMGLGMHFV